MTSNDAHVPRSFDDHDGDGDGDGDDYTLLLAPATAALRRDFIASTKWFDRPEESGRASPHMSALTVRTTRQDNLTIVAVEGSLDLTTARRLSEEISGRLGDNPLKLIVDLSETTFMACVGMTVLLSVHLAVSRSGSFGVVADGYATASPLRLVGLDRTLAIYPDLDAATAAMA